MEMYVSYVSAYLDIPYIVPTDICISMDSAVTPFKQTLVGFATRVA